MTALLRARVEVQLQDQNRGLLNSMDRRARLQLRLQETVEGLSVVAISYYGLGLVGYALKGLAEAGIPVDPTLGVAAALPLVVGSAWLGLKLTKRRLQRDEEQQSKHLSRTSPALKRAARPGASAAVARPHRRGARAETPR